MFVLDKHISNVQIVDYAIITGKETFNWAYPKFQMSMMVLWLGMEVVAEI